MCGAHTLLGTALHSVTWSRWSEALNCQPWFWRMSCSTHRTTVAPKTYLHFYSKTNHCRQDLLLEQMPERNLLFLWNKEHNGSWAADCPARQHKLLLSLCFCLGLIKLKLCVTTVAIELVSTTVGSLLREPYCYGSRVEVSHTSLQDFARGGPEGNKTEKRTNKESGETELGRRRRKAMRRTQARGEDKKMDETGRHQHRKGRSAWWKRNR